jgi:hypothetical protein
MLILLKIAAILAFIILPLISPKRKIKTYKKDAEVSAFVVGEDGGIRNKDDDNSLRQHAHEK